MANESTAQPLSLERAPPARVTHPVVRFWNENALSLGAVLAVILLAEAYVRLFQVPQFFFPAPSVVLEQLISRRAIILQHSLWTTTQVLLGYLMGVLVGIPLAIAIVYSKFFEKTIFAFLVSSQAIPKVAIAPILITWFGYGQTPKIIITFLISFFPIVVSTVVGLRSMPVEMLNLARSLGASNLEIFWKFRFPYGLPTIFGGLKVAISLAVVGAVVGDYVAGIRGLGYLQIFMAANVNTPMVFAILAALSLIGIILFYMVTIIEKLTVHWDPGRQAERDQQR